MSKSVEYITKKEFNEHKKEVSKMIKEAVKEVKKWDVKQDKKLISKKSK
jgi:hypothetical protein